MSHTFRSSALILLLSAGLLPEGRCASPTDNPVATFYAGPEGYPAWTDTVNWRRVIDMKTYAPGKTAFEKFEKARDALSETGGVLYYPAGTYDFTSKPPGRGLFLRGGVVIRGEAPTGRPVAADGKLDLPTKFVFPFRKRGGGQVPGDWNLIGLQGEKGKKLKDVDKVGIAWVHLVGATVYFGPQLDWGKTWATAESFMSDRMKKGWGMRTPDGTHPFDPFAGGGKKYQGAGKGRLVFGCVFQDAAGLDDFTDPGYGPDGFHTQRYGARIAVYGSRVLVANNSLPRSAKNFKYAQKTSTKPKKGSYRVLFDYGKTCGIDINKEMLGWASADGTCPGYFEQGVVVRDNRVFNHGHKGYNVSGNWVTISNNHNERIFFRQNAAVYNLPPTWALTADGYQLSTAATDNASRAFDLAGRNLWIDGNRFGNTGSSPGDDGEGILCRSKGGTRLLSWAITRNVHTRGTGSAGSIGGKDVGCHGLLIAWNQTTGWVGDSTTRKGLTLTNCAFVANKGSAVKPDAKTVARFDLRAPLTADPAGVLNAPTGVKAKVYEDDAVEITWTDVSTNEIGFRVDRRIGDGKWQAIAYRPPHLADDSENPQAWVDFTAPTGKDLTYRVVAIDSADDDKGASAPTEAVRIGTGA